MENVRDSAESKAMEQQAQALYETTLKSLLEPAHNGEAIAIHMPSSQYVTDKNWANAMRRMRQRSPGGYIFVRFIGPVTDNETRLAQRVGGEPK